MSAFPFGDIAFFGAEELKSDAGSEVLAASSKRRESAMEALNAKLKTLGLEPATMKDLA